MSRIESALRRAGLNGAETETEQARGVMFASNVQAPAFVIELRDYPSEGVPHSPSLPPGASVAELRGMRIVADGLASLDDDEARARVLRWAAQSFLGSDGSIPHSRRQEPVVSMIRSFVEDFQKLARDWNGE